MQINYSIVAFAAIATLAAPATVFAGKQAKQDICHWDADAELFKVISVSGNAVAKHMANHGDILPGTWFTDADGDGYGDAGAATDPCPNAGFVDNSNDCNDADAAINPAAEEACGDDIDNNCSGEVDENCSYLSCKDLLDKAPGSPDGVYSIDPDGTGPTVAQDAYCDMTHSGGGWTNVDFALNRVVLANGNFVFCNGGLSANGTSITCKNPIFNGNMSMPLYHYYCNGSDGSADYILDYMAPWLGHNTTVSLGFSGLYQRYNGQGQPRTSQGRNEFCYIAGEVVRYDDPKCHPYSNNRNGNCIPNFFTLSI